MHDYALEKQKQKNLFYMDEQRAWENGDNK